MKKLLASLMALALAFSFAACGKEEEETAETTVPESTVNFEEMFAEMEEDESEEVAEETEVEETEEPETSVVEVTNAEGEAVTDKDGEAVTETVTQKPEETKKPTTTKKKTDDPSDWSTDKILDYSNKALNKVKSSKAGYTKNAVMEIKGDVSGLPEVLKKIFQTNKTTTMSKGSDNTNDFPAAGYTWSTCLRPQDVEKAALKVNGSTYDIMIKLGTEKNPGKGTASSYGRAVSVIDAAEAANMIPFGINSVDMNYHDGYIYIKVDSKTGQVTYAQFSAAADAKANLAVLGDVQADSITSTETFTNFVW